MSDLSQKPVPNYAPTYAAAMYPELAAICRKHGYALAVHGSLSRDLDLIAIPWTEDAGEPESIINEVLSTWAVSKLSEIKKTFPHGRMALTLCVGWGECAIDFQFMPRKTPYEGRDGFEMWANQQGVMTDKVEGKYKYAATQLMWEAWCIGKDGAE